jgi:hypothetical protein
MVRVTNMHPLKRTPDLVILGWCGSTTAYCGAGCNPKFGICNKDTTVSSTKIVTSSRARTSPAGVVPTRTPSSSVGPVASSQPLTTNARCGPSFGGMTCQGSKWGNCKFFGSQTRELELTLHVFQAAHNIRTAAPRSTTAMPKPVRRASDSATVSLLACESRPL